MLEVSWFRKYVWQVLYVIVILFVEVYPGGRVSNPTVV